MTSVSQYQFGLHKIEITAHSWPRGINQVFFSKYFFILLWDIFFQNWLPHLGLHLWRGKKFQNQQGSLKFGVSSSIKKSRRFGNFVMNLIEYFNLIDALWNVWGRFSNSGWIQTTNNGWRQPISDFWHLPSSNWSRDCCLCWNYAWLEGKYSCNKITTTWIQISRQNWNGFFHRE